MENYDDYIEDLAQKYDIIPAYKDIKGHSFAEMRKLTILIKNILYEEISNYGFVSILGEECDIKWFSGFLTKKEFKDIRDKIVFLPSEQTLFKAYGYSNPSDLYLKCIQNKKGKIVIISENRRVAEHVFFKKGIPFTDIFDEFEYRGYRYVGEKWERRSVKRFKIKMKDIIDKLNVITRGQIKKCNNTVKNYLEDLDKKKNIIEEDVDICVIKELYENAGGEHKEFYLKKLIWSLYTIRDWEQLYLYLEMASENKYKELHKDIKIIVDKLYLDISNRKEPAIVMQWIDALPQNDVDEWKLFEKIQNDSYVFTNLYSGTPYTSVTEKSIFLGGLLIDDELYKREAGGKTLLLQILNKNGYSLVSFSKHLEVGICERIKKKETRYKIDALPMSLIQWNVLVELAIEGKKVIIAHTMNMHDPYFTSEMTDVFIPNGKSKEEINKVRKNSARYVERKIYEYANIVKGTSVSTIYFSDHGTDISDNVVSNWSERSNHAFCFINSAGNVKNCKGINKRYIQHKDFYKIIAQLIRNDCNFDEMGNDYALLQGEDPYSAEKVKMLLEYNKSGKGSRYWEFMQYRGVKTADYKYIKYPVGEIFMKEPGDIFIDEDKIIPSEKEKLRKLAGNIFINIENERKYKQIYDAYVKMGYIKDGEWKIPDSQ